MHSFFDITQYRISVHDLLLKFRLEGSHTPTPPQRLHLYFPMQITLHSLSGCSTSCRRQGCSVVLSLFLTSLVQIKPRYKTGFSSRHNFCLPPFVQVNRRRRPAATLNWTDQWKQCWPFFKVWDLQDFLKCAVFFKKWTWTKCPCKGNLNETLSDITYGFQMIWQIGSAAYFRLHLVISEERATPWYHLGVIRP